MKLKESIAKHSLALCRKVPGGLHSKIYPNDILLLMNEESPFAKTDRLGIYGYPERTDSVSVNRTAGIFRILRRDLMSVMSEWRSSNEFPHIRSVPDLARTVGWTNSLGLYPGLPARS